MIDKTDPMPLYLQLSDWIEKMIKRETFKVGSKLTSEGELAKDFQLNRNTVRHAISLLVHRGLLEKRKGVGTFMRRKTILYPIHQLGKMTSFIDDFELNDVEIEDRIIYKGKVKASSEIAEKLMLNKGEQVVKIERLRIADKTPFLLEIQFYSFQDFGELLDMEIKGSMYRLLTNKFNADLHHSSQAIRAVKAPRDVVQKCGMSRFEPCMFLESLAYTSQNKCIEVLHSYYRGDRYLFRVETGQYRREISSAEVK